MSTVHKTLSGHNAALSDCAWSFDSKTLATASDDCDVFIWDIETGRCLMILSGHSAPVLCCNYSPTNTLVASASCDETVRLWDTSNGNCVSVLPAHADPVTAIYFSDDGTVLLSTSHDGIWRAWDVHTGCCLKSVDLHVALSSVLYTPKSQVICTLTSNGELLLWDLVVEKCIARLRCERKRCVDGLQPCFVKKESCFLVVVSGKDSLYIWEMKTGVQKLNFETIDVGQYSTSTLVVYSESSDCLVTCSSGVRDMSVWVSK